MKTKKLLLGAVIASAVLFAACGKDDKAPTTTERVQQKWTFEKDYYYEVAPGFPEYRDTTIGVAGEYADFRTDNKLYSFIDGDYDTVSYSILSDSKIIIDGDTGTIQTLNDSQFQLFNRGGNYPTDYFEYTIYLKK